MRALLVLFFLVEMSYSQTILGYAVGRWSNSGGKSTTDAGNPKYSFTVNTAGSVQIDLVSQANGDRSASLIDNYVYLLDGTGNKVDENDDAGGRTNGRIVRTLTPGNWTVVAATLSAGQIGEFKVQLVAPAGSPVGVSFTSSILTQPAPIAVPLGRCAILKVYVGLGNSIQWQRNGSNIDGATDYACPILSASSADAGTYRCLVTAGGTTITSNGAALTVNPASPLPSNLWTQPSFVVGGWVDPSLTGVAATDLTAYQRFRNAHFNLALGFPAWSAGPSFPSNNPGNWMDFNSGSCGSVYRLQLVSQIFGLSMLSFDRRLAAPYPFSDPKSTAVVTNYNSAISDYTTNLSGMAGNLRGAYYGYHLSDEPYFLSDTHDNDATLWNYSAAEQLQKIETLQINDPPKLAWVNLRSNWDGNWSRYQRYVHGYASNPYCKVLSYDNYLFKYDAAGAVTFAGNPYYRHLDLFAHEASQNNKSLWVYGASSEEVTSNGHLIFPDQLHMGYTAYSSLLYGAKGVLWYTYQITGFDATGHSPLLHSPNDGTVQGDAIYASLSAVNSVLENLGPTIINLNWLGVAHGASTDPVSGESGLPVMSSIASVQSYVTQTTTLDPSLALSVFTNSISGEGYLMVFNKNLSGAAITNKFYVNGQVIPRLHNKTSNSWSPIPRSYSLGGTTNFTVSVQPGDIQFIRLSRPISNPALALPGQMQ